MFRNGHFRQNHFRARHFGGTWGQIKKVFVLLGGEIKKLMPVVEFKKIAPFVEFRHGDK